MHDSLLTSTVLMLISPTPLFWHVMWLDPDFGFKSCITSADWGLIYRVSVLCRVIPALLGSLAGGSKLDHPALPLSFLGTWKHAGQARPGPQWLNTTNGALDDVLRDLVHMAIGFSVHSRHVHIAPACGCTRICRWHLVHGLGGR